MPDDWGEYPYRVVSTGAVTPVIRELWLEPIEDPLPYRAGQYALLCDAAFAVPQRSYSLANAPRPDGRVSVLVTLVPDGPTSTWAHGLTPRDEVVLEGPFGTFTTGESATGPVLLLGAGSGLAPVRALAESLLDAGARDRDVTLYFSARSEADVIDRERFEALAREHDRFDYRVAITRSAGGRRHERIPSRLHSEFATLRGFEVFAAGPPGFVAGCQAAASALGAERIRTEEFFADPTPWREAMPAAPGPELYLEVP